ncbi:MAG: hypothetical protein JHD35_22625 [Sphingopyxis sp.]|nr:hypothetical protein [Sphingopyxis sp.]
MDKGGQTDAAALGAGVVAVVVSILTADGPFEFSGVVISATLVFIVVGYMGSHTRTTLQSLAFATVLGTFCWPVAGFMFEKVAGPWQLNVPKNGSWVKPESLVVVWFFVSAILFFFDVWRHRSKPN